MAKNRVTAIDTRFEAAVPEGTQSGWPVMVLDGTVPAVAQTNEGEGVGNVAGRASVDTEGIHAFPCADAVAAEGTAVYVGTDGAVTTTAGDAEVFGYTIHMPSPVGRGGGTKAAGEGTVNVRLRKA